MHKIGRGDCRMINGDAHLQMEIPMPDQPRKVRMDWPDALGIVDDAIESQKNNLSDAQIDLLSSAWNRIQQG